MVVSTVQAYLLPMAYAICDVDWVLAWDSRSQVVMALSGCYGTLGLLCVVKILCRVALYVMYNTWYCQKVGTKLVGVAVGSYLLYEHIFCLWLVLSVT